MIFAQTITIPVDRKVRLDLNLPDTVPCGTVCLMLAPQMPPTMLMSEASLAKDWNSPEEEWAWADL
jgi:hypothetical protein